MFRSREGRLLQARAILNVEPSTVVLPAGTVFRSETTELVLDSRDEKHGAKMLEYFDGAVAFLSALRISPVPRLRVAVVPTTALPSSWEGSLRDGTLTTAFYYTGSELISPAGRWLRLDDDLGLQLIAAWHEIVEMALVSGTGMRIPLGDEQRLRWLREGLATYLGERTIDRLFLCRPFKGSQLEMKFHYASVMGSDILRWREARGGEWNRGYAGSLGLMHAFNEVSGGAFPRLFCQTVAVEGHTTADGILGVLDKTIGLPVSVFVSTVRRPLPELIPEKNSQGLVVPARAPVYADAPGLRPNDLFVSVGEMPTNNLTELDTALWKAGVAESFTISVRRDGAIVKVQCIPLQPRFRKGAGK